jgi:hypothetical protein
MELSESDLKCFPMQDQDDEHSNMTSFLMGLTMTGGAANLSLLEARPYPKCSSASATMLAECRSPIEVQVDTTHSYLAKWLEPERALGIRLHRYSEMSCLSETRMARCCTPTKHHLGTI